MSEPSLEDVLSGEESAEESTDTGEKSEPPSQESEDKTEEKTDEKTEEVSKADDVKADDTPKDVMVPLAAQLDERDKRQKAERRADELQRQLNTKEPEKKIDPLEDPEGFQNQNDQQIRTAVFKMERKFMAKLHDDWDDAETWINSELGTNVALQTKLQNSEDLLEDAYTMYQNHLKLQQLEDVDAMTARLTAEIETKVRAELGIEKKGGEDKANKDAEATDKPSVVTSGASQSIGHEGEMTLEDIVGSDFNTRPK